MKHNRMQLHLRSAIDRYLANGWEIVSRDPITLKRGRQSVQLINGVLNSH